MKIKNENEKVQFLKECLSHIQRINQSFESVIKISEKFNPLPSNIALSKGGRLGDLRTAKIFVLVSIYNKVMKESADKEIDLQKIYKEIKPIINAYLKRNNFANADVLMKIHRLEFLNNTSSLFIRFLNFIWPPKSVAFFKSTGFFEVADLPEQLKGHEQKSQLSEKIKELVNKDDAIQLQNLLLQNNPEEINYALRVAANEGAFNCVKCLIDNMNADTLACGAGTKKIALHRAIEKKENLCIYLLLRATDHAGKPLWAEQLFFGDKPNRPFDCIKQIKNSEDKNKILQVISELIGANQEHCLLSEDEIERLAEPSVVNVASI